MRNESEGLKIVRLEAENVKRLKAVSITPHGNVVEITGANGQGKTSILDAIWWALAGLSVISRSPIREGEETASIQLDLGKIVVTRTFNRAADGVQFTTKVTVESADGARFPSPQTLLDGLLGKLSLDPLEFARMEPKKQVEALRRFVPDFDFDAVDREYQTLYEKRRNANAFAKSSRQRVSDMRVPAERPKPIDVAAVTAEYEAAVAHNARNREMEAEFKRLQDSVAAGERRREKLIEEYKLAMQTWERRLKEMADEMEALNKRSSELGLTEIYYLPVDELKVKISDAKVAAEGIASLERRDEELQLARKYEAESERLTASLKAIERRKQNAIEEAKLPVAGLGFGDGCVTFKGIPFDQASDAEQLRISTAIAMAGRGDLAVIRIRDGSLLDENSMRVLAEMADAADCQVWIERVDTSGKVGFVVEDGTVRDTGEHLGKENAR